MLTQCEGLVALLIARGHIPRAMIWAGVGYDGASEIVTDFDEYYARLLRADHEQRPDCLRRMTIIHTPSAGTDHAEPACHTPTPPISTRHVIVRRSAPRFRVADRVADREEVDS